MIKRTLLEPVQSHLEQKEISLIIGPRQAGKTTLMRLLKENLDRKGERTLFLSLDLEADRQFFSSQQSLLSKIELELGRDKGFVFIDEIQRRQDAGIFLKGLYDMNLPYKLVVSGSGSIELKEKVHESLIGRKRLFEISTLTFEEFAHFRLDYKYENELPTFFALHPAKGKELLDEYLNFGGYPRVVLAPTFDEKQAVISDIYQSYLEKDIALLLNLQKTESLTNLVKILASQVGNLVNVSELSATLGLSMNTVKNYLWYLEKTFIIRKVFPYFKNIRKELTKMSTIYFVDLGLKNYAVGQFGTAVKVLPQGFLFENFIYNNLLEKITNTILAIHFWRTKDKAEVDFVLNSSEKVVPIEVKYQSLKKSETSRSFKSFLTNYKSQKAYIVHLGSQFEKRFNSTRIFFIPYYECAQIINNFKSNK